MKESLDNELYMYIAYTQKTDCHLKREKKNEQKRKKTAAFFSKENYRFTVSSEPFSTFFLIYFF